VEIVPLNLLFLRRKDTVYALMLTPDDKKSKILPFLLESMVAEIK
jgi:hypothetical protein